MLVGSSITQPLLLLCRLTARPPLPLLCCVQAPAPHICLQAVQQLLVQPDLTLPVVTFFRPVLLKAVSGLVEAAVGPGDNRGGSGGPQPGPGTLQGSPELAVALLSVLELAPHSEG